MKSTLILSVGPVSEQQGPVVPTPQFREWPILGTLLMFFKMTDSQQVVLSVGAYKDKKGNVTTPPPGGTVVFSVDNPALIALTPADDGQSCLAVAVGPVGTATVGVKLQAGDGTVLASGTIDIEIDTGAAVTIDITPGTPTEQP